MTVTGASRGLLDLAGLTRFFHSAGIAVSGDLVAQPITGGRSNLTFKVSDSEHSWVVRRPPVAGLTPSAHDVGRELSVVAALQETNVPVPPAVANCTDLAWIGAPFTVVGFVAGESLQTQHSLQHLTDVQLGEIHRELIRVLVVLHDVPYQRYGLAGFGRPVGYLERQVRRWRQQWDLVATRPLDDVERLYRRLEEQTWPTTRSALVHGDYRVDNTLLDLSEAARIAALIDWEMSTLGDPLSDVATMCVYHHPAFDHVVGIPAASTSSRWPGIDATVQDYAERSGAEMSDFDGYLALAYFKLAVIAEGIASRYLAGAGEGPGFDSAAEAVPALIAAGLSAAQGRT
jgi:aminoglycoside phosphotransferase (APT) family kinase protein